MRNRFLSKLNKNIEKNIACEINFIDMIIKTLTLRKILIH